MLGEAAGAVAEVGVDSYGDIDEAVTVEVGGLDVGDAGTRGDGFGALECAVGTAF